MRTTIRRETPDDADPVRRVNELAFGRPHEAALVDALRGSVDAVSLVAVVGDHVVGHVLFTSVRIEGSQRTTAAVGLGPMAVLPEHQRRGVGSALVRAGLDVCRRLGHAVVVVLGHPAYYQRFGFVAAGTKGIQYERVVPSEAFLVLELRTGAVARSGGVVRYRPEFTAV
jgi:putative acetyltransferase